MTLGPRSVRPWKSRTKKTGFVARNDSKALVYTHRSWARRTRARRLKLRYMTQANTRPPTFALFASKPGELPDSYRRYLVNALRQDFDLPGTPIRLMLRKGDNPYARAKS